ncbi:histidine triad nucleotide-binding protein [Terracoccus luteus]|uniref:Histidine triad (HIT) family protein n=1 Tax=Terracoccus luteus TaxID=53356 RepID=A0A839PPY2_9MICO|nr:histidine triad nucleotide-binding protein [Terracoccus luteus]MBB2985073.1 histidine triad (HIT) family protein [Terracoccus luteus]MCP2170725.1 histidine triad (HIT) family protein [Terracoccus luteus]
MSSDAHETGTTPGDGGAPASETASDTTSDCVFCAIADGRIPAQVVAESERSVAFEDRTPAAPVHVLVIPRRHAATVAELAEASTDDLADLFAVIPEVARAKGITDYRLMVNSGASVGQTVFHAHVHVLGGADFTEASMTPQA